MRFYADLHVHSKYSRATSRDCDLEHLALWARRKGLAVVASGDFTHPAWFQELREKLLPAEPGLFRLNPELDREVLRGLPAACQGEVRFTLSVEISTIYKKGERTRKVHHLLYAPDLEAADRIRQALGRIGNLASDGRPILGLDSRHLLEITLEAGEGCFLVPAHVWTPWFAVLGSKSGFDSISECYGDLASHVFAAETGLSSDPPMNWRVSSLDRYRLVSSSDAHSPAMLAREACVFDCPLDYHSIRGALRTGAGYGGTLEFFPEEGKYHLDGHRACGVRLEPAQTRERGGACPSCGKPLTVGVMHRVEELADRPEGARPEGAAPFRSLVPLPELVSEIRGVGAGSVKVEADLAALSGKLGPELAILHDLPLEEVRAAAGELLAEAIARLRRGQVRKAAGFDGEFGTVRVFDEGELDRLAGARLLFDLPRATPKQARGRRRQGPPAAALELVQAEAAPAPAALPETQAVAPTGVLAALDEEQRQAAAVAEGALLIVAGPGTGKTRTLTHRLAHLVAELGAPPESCLALTFTRRAAGEMRERLEALVPGAARRMTVTTFHGLGLQILREHRERLGLPEGFRVADEQQQLELARDLLGGREQDGPARLAELSAARRRGDWGSLADWAERYRAALRARGLVDFDELVELPVALLEQAPALAAAYRERYRWISVDEYQDVDALQYRLVRLLAGKGGNVCAIGDPDQAIYSFRGADVAFFLQFQRDYPGAKVVHLTRNYRSSPAIVRAAVQAIAKGSLVPGRALSSVSSTPAPAKLFLAEASSERAEAEQVAHAIEQLVGGTSHFSFDSGRALGLGEERRSFSDFAVLYRTGSQAAAVMEALGRLGVPFQKGGEDRLLSRPGVRRMARSLTAVAPSPRPVLEQLRELASALVQAGEDERELSGAVDLLEPLARRHAGDLAAFLEALALGAEVDALDPRADRVSLLTLHASKGLEFPVVFLVGCEAGLLPLERGELAEERRLFFVGLTRAKSHLFLLRARRRTRFGEAAEPEASPFLADIAPELIQKLDRPARPAPRARQLQLF